MLRFYSAVLVIVAASPLTACGKGSSAQPVDGGAVDSGVSVGTGGTGSVGGGGTAGAAGGGGTAGTGTGGAQAQFDSLRSACVEYITKQCTRKFQCGEFTDLDQCLAFDECPDRMLSDGSTRTAAGLRECADEWLNLSCDDIWLGVAPACATPGTRLPGEDCRYSSQCRSSLCDRRDDECGVCLEDPVGLGEDCSDTACAPTLRCDDDRCVPRVVPTYTEIVGKGAPCEDADCQKPFACGGVPGSRRCVDPPSVGEKCLDGRCTLDAFCNSSDRCERLPGPGEDCTPDDDLCDPTSLCSGGECEPRRSLGQSCRRSGDNGQQGTCAPGLVCACEDSGCDDRQCIDLAEEGEACGQPFNECNNGLVCESGFCEATDELVLFEQFCSPR